MWSLGDVSVVDWPWPFFDADGPFYFWTLYCCQVVYDCIDSGMIDESDHLLSIRDGVYGGLMSMELTIVDGITMAGLDDRILL